MDVEVSPGASDNDVPALDRAQFLAPDPATLRGPVSCHPPRILLLHGSLRARSYSRLLADEAERLLAAMGCETRRYNPAGLPLPDDAEPSHPKVVELRAASLWSEGQVWVSPERHGTLTGVMKSQIDWLPLEERGIRPTQGRTLAVMQVSGSSQSFNAANAMRLLGRWMRMVTIPNQSRVPKAYEQFDPGRADAAVGAVRPRGRRLRGAGALHLTHPLQRRRAGRPLQQAGLAHAERGCGARLG